MYGFKKRIRFPFYLFFLLFLSISLLKLSASQHITNIIKETTMIETTELNNSIFKNSIIHFSSIYSESLYVHWVIPLKPLRIFLDIPYLVHTRNISVLYGRYTKPTCLHYGNNEDIYRNNRALFQPLFQRHIFQPPATNCHYLD